MTVARELTVCMRHVRAAGFCARGARTWAIAHRLDWAAFVAHGITAAQLIATGDALALRVVEVARQEHGGG